MEPKSERRCENDPASWKPQIRSCGKASKCSRSSLTFARRLQLVATQLINVHGIEALYEQILDTAMAVLHSDFASIQMFYPERGAQRRA